MKPALAASCPWGRPSIAKGVRPICFQRMVVANRRGLDSGQIGKLFDQLLVETVDAGVVAGILIAAASGLIEITRSGWKPGSTCCKRQKLMMSKPALMTSITAMEI